MPIQYVENHPTVAYDGVNDKLKVNDATLEQKIDDLNTKIDAIISGDSPATTLTELSGSIVEIGEVTYAVSGGDTIRNTAANKPDAAAAHAVIPFCYYFAVDTGTVEATDGTSWVVL